MGLMSGTSLDGLDIALCRLSGSGVSTGFRLMRFRTVPYPPSVKARIARVFAKPQVEFLQLCELHAWMGHLHGDMINRQLKTWGVKNTSVDVIASHGQTVFHAPRAVTPGATINSTFQAGDGDHVAATTGIVTISDFRQKHIAMGGEGAPLAVYGDYLLLGKKGEDRVLLNMGGIANFTYLPASARASQVFVTDTGPGNTLLDQTIQHFKPGVYFDRDAQLARSGKVNKDFLLALKSDRFFRLPFPKTTGPELFNLTYAEAALKRAGIGTLPLADRLATLTRFSAETIAVAVLRTMGKQKFGCFVSGGGAHNPLLMQMLRELLLAARFQPTDVLGIPGDAKEAILFAVLANETLAGGETDFSPRSKVPTVCMGKISFPK